MILVEFEGDSMDMDFMQLVYAAGFAIIGCLLVVGAVAVFIWIRSSQQNGD